MNPKLLNLIQLVNEIHCGGDGILNRSEVNTSMCQSIYCYECALRKDIETSRIAKSIFQECISDYTNTDT